MSDVMFYGILRMPYEMVVADNISLVQFYGRAQEAANRVESAEAELNAARALMREFLEKSSDVTYEFYEDDFFNCLDKVKNYLDACDTLEGK